MEKSFLTFWKFSEVCGTQSYSSPKLKEQRKEWRYDLTSDGAALENIGRYVSIVRKTQSIWGLVRSRRGLYVQMRNRCVDFRWIDGLIRRSSNTWLPRSHSSCIVLGNLTCLMSLIEDIGCSLTFEWSEKIYVFEYSESLRMMLRESHNAIYKYKYPSAWHYSLAVLL